MAERKEKKMKDEVFEKLKEYCPSGFVTRRDIYELTGGLLRGSTLACIECQHGQIKNKRIVGGTTLYPIEELIEWLKNNTELVNFDD